MNVLKHVFAVMHFFLNIFSFLLQIVFSGKIKTLQRRKLKNHDKNILLLKWQREQLDIRKKIILIDTEEWQIKRLLASSNDTENDDQSSLQKPKLTIDQEDKDSNFQQSDDDDALQLYCALDEETVANKIISTAELITSSRKLLSHDSKLLEYVGGIDISFLKGDEKTACVALVVIRVPEFEVVYEDCTVVRMDIPYIPGYLSFRELLPSLQAIHKLVRKNLDTIPQVILVDGNGILHTRECGLACHLGVVLDIPTVGVAKNLFIMDKLQRDSKHQAQINNLKNRGDFFHLSTTEGKILGMALKTNATAVKPVYVSVGHKISLDTARWLVLLCSQYRIPEPTRQADIKSREYIRKNLL